MTKSFQVAAYFLIVLAFAASFPLCAQNIGTTLASDVSTSGKTWTKWKWEGGWNGLFPEESTFKDAEKVLGKGVFLPQSDTFRFQNAVDIRFSDREPRKIFDIVVFAAAADIPGFPHFPANKREYEQIYSVHCPSVTPTYSSEDPEKIVKLRFWKLQIIDPEPEGQKQRYCHF
ncbi:MAG TPA: hypothetical protein V6C86_17645 [Oculatellaceae cyanobacterium]